MERNRFLANNNKQNNDDIIATYGLNLTEYALKYIGCQNIHTYSDDLADNEESDTVLEMDKFVILRLCPRSSCSNYNQYGCNSGFGDLMITMEEYLQAMAESFFNEYQTYCETCYSCMHHNDKNANDGYVDDKYFQGDDQYSNNNNNGNSNNNNNNNNNYNNNGNNNYNNNGNNNNNYNNNKNYNNNNNKNNNYNNKNNNYNYNNNNRRLGDDAYNQNQNANGDDAANAANDDYVCEYQNVCENYRTACKEYSPKATDLADYFQCTAFNVGGSNSYLGAHCRSDGKTIGIGIFQDDGCNKYIGDLVDISSYTGMDLSDEYLKAYYSDNCISCLASVSF